MESMVLTSKKQRRNWIDLGAKIRTASFLLIPRGQLVKKSGDSGYHGLEPRKSVGLQIQHQGMIFQEEVVLLNGKETIEKF